MTTPVVQFAENFVVRDAATLQSSALSDKEKDAMWYQEKEKEEMRRNAMIRAMAILQSHLDDASDPRSFSNTLERMFRQCKQGSGKPSKESVQHLVYLYHAAPLNRGIEHLSVQTLFVELKGNKKRHSQSVLRLQQELRDHNIPQDEIWESLHRTSKHSSRTDKKFALLLGRVDATLVKVEAERTRLRICKQGIQSLLTTAAGTSSVRDAIKKSSMGHVIKSMPEPRPSIVISHQA